MIKKLCFAILILFAIASLSFAGPNMKEGLWEITSEVVVTGMPAPMPATTFTKCLTKEDLVPSSGQSNQNCENVNVKVRGNTVTWTMKCTDSNGTTVGNGNVTYRGGTFSGQINMQVKYPGQPEMNMTTTMSGRRIGDCD